MIEQLLNPLPKELSNSDNYHPQQWGNIIKKNDGTLPTRATAQIAIVGVAEGRGSGDNHNTEYAASNIRSELYKLYAEQPLQVIDMGDIAQGATLEDTNSALAIIASELMQENIVPIILGGSQALTVGQYKAYQQMERFVNFCVVDSKINYNEEPELSADNFLHAIITHQPNYLFNFSHLAHQTYLTQPNLIQSLKELNFECSRLGDVQEDLKEIEPILRNTDMLSFDLSAIRMSDSPAHADGSPHGLYGEQACAIARYAGISNTLSSFGLYELNPLLDPTKQSTKLAAHLVWHFLQGFANRKAEHPLQHPKNFIRYMVSLQANDYEIVFWKSKTNDRWWMELPTFNNRTLLEKRFIPCSHKDYITASQDEIPLRWLNALHRMH